MTEQHKPEFSHNPHYVHTIDTSSTNFVPLHTSVTIDSGGEPGPHTIVAAPLIAGLCEGRIVHYVLSDGKGRGQHRPGIVVRDWRRDDGLVNLQVFTDGRNDYDEGQDGYNGMQWVTSIKHDDNGAPGTWHYPERI